MEKKGKKFDERLKELKEFCERENRLPNYRLMDEKELSLLNFINYYREREDIDAIVNKYKKKSSFERNLQELEEYFKKNGRLPTNSRDDNMTLYKFFNWYRSDERLKPIIEKVKAQKEEGFRADLQELREYCKVNGKLPKEGKLKNFINRYKKSNPEVSEIVETYKKDYFINLEERLLELQEFCNRTGRLPRSTSEDRGEVRMAGFVGQYREKDSRVKEIVETYRKHICTPRSFEEKLKDLRKYCELNKDCPIIKDRKLYSFVLSNKCEPKVIKIIKEFNREEIFETIDKKKLEDFAKFIKEYNELPKYKTNPKLCRFFNLYKFHPEVIKLTVNLRINLNYDKFMGEEVTVDSFEEVLDELVAFCYKWNRLPKIAIKEEGRLSRFIYKHIDNIEVMSIVNEFKNSEEYFEFI